MGSYSACHHFTFLGVTRTRKVMYFPNRIILAMLTTVRFFGLSGTTTIRLASKSTATTSRLSPDQGPPGTRVTLRGYVPGMTSGQIPNVCNKKFGGWSNGLWVGFHGLACLRRGTTLVALRAPSENPRTPRSMSTPARANGRVPFLPVRRPPPALPKGLQTMTRDASGLA